MPVGDCQHAFGEAARLDGVQLVSATVEGLTDAGHLALPASAKATMRLLRAIFVALGGNEDDLRAGTHRALRPDWFHEPSDTAIEVDEQQHFTTDRLAALTLYPQDAPLGFDRSEYIALCEEHRGRSDRYRSAKEARGFRRPVASAGRRGTRALASGPRYARRAQAAEPLRSEQLARTCVGGRPRPSSVRTRCRERRHGAPAPGG